MFNYKNNTLHFGDRKPINLLSFSKKKKTPFYLYDLNHVKKRFKIFRDYLGRETGIFYSVKANSNFNFLKLFKKLNCGVDVVSLGELKLSLKTGFSGNKIIFSGVGKTKKEIEFAILSSIKQINVESLQELIRIGETAKSLSKKANVAFRMNPQVNPVSHPYIVTGFRENKFGMDPDLISDLKSVLKRYKRFLNLKGLAMHIGSQLTEITAFREAIRKIKPLLKDLKNDLIEIKCIDVGGGVGIFYQDENEAKEIKLLKDYADMVKRETASLPCEVVCEPGRWLVARSGVLITEIQYIKKNTYKNFIIVNTGMHHLIRPALYQSYHRILPVVKESKNDKKENLNQNLYDIVGPICESSDYLGKERTFQSVSQGDLLAVCDVGAYGFSMANQYNMHKFPKEYFF